MSSDAQSFGQLLNKNSSLFYVICNREVVARAGAVLSNNDIPVTGPLDQGGKGPNFARYVNPISIRGQISPTSLLFAPSPEFLDLPTVLSQVQMKRAKKKTSCINDLSTMSISLKNTRKKRYNF